MRTCGSLLAAKQAPARLPAAVRRLAMFLWQPVASQCVSLHTAWAWADAMKQLVEIASEQTTGENFIAGLRGQKRLEDEFADLKRGWVGLKFQRNYAA